MPKSVSGRLNTQVTPEPAPEKRTRRIFKAEYKLGMIAESKPASTASLEPFCAVKSCIAINAPIGEENLRKLAWPD